MARTNSQIIINYHTSGTSLPQAGNVELGEVVVLHNPDKAEIVIKDNNGNLHEFVDSASVISIATEVANSSASGLSAVSALTVENAEEIGEISSAVTSQQEALELLLSAVTENTEAIEKKVDAVEGYRLMSDEEGEKLGSIEASAQTNVIESIMVNNVELEVKNKAVNINIESQKAYKLIALDEPNSGALKTYRLQANNEDIEGSVDIDLAKDLVVTSGSVVKDPEGQAKGTYLKLTIANQEAPVYINVADLVDVYTGDNQTIQVSDENVISVKEDVFADKEHEHVVEDVKITEDFKYSDETLAVSGDSVMEVISEISDIVLENEKVTAEALVDLDSRIKGIESLSGSSHTHANKAVLDTITEAKTNAWDSAATYSITGVTVNGEAAEVVNKVVSIDTLIKEVESTENVELDVSGGTLTATILKIDGGEF